MTTTLENNDYMRNDNKLVRPRRASTVTRSLVDRTTASSDRRFYARLTVGSKQELQLRVFETSGQGKTVSG